MKEILDLLHSFEEKTVEPGILKRELEAIKPARLFRRAGIPDIQPDKYHRRMLMQSPFEVFIMEWAPQFFFPIHQHNNFWGFVIPLQGILSETIYGYAPNKKKVFIHPTRSHKSGDLIYEPVNVIHKLQNISPIDPLFTLHVYYPAPYTFKGTMMLDAKNRTIAILNEKAPMLSWDLPEDNYELIQEEAYDLEKLW